MFTKKPVDLIAEKDFFEMWELGLGQAFCSSNPNDADVSLVRIREKHCYDRAIGALITGGVSLAISLFFIRLWLNVDHIDIDYDYLGDIIGEGIAFGLIIFPLSYFETIRCLKKAHRLKRNDISVFSAEKYEPIVRKLKRKSIQWGLDTKIIEINVVGTLQFGNAPLPITRSDANKRIDMTFKAAFGGIIIFFVVALIILIEKYYVA